MVLGDVDLDLTRAITEAMPSHIWDAKLAEVPMGRVGELIRRRSSRSIGRRQVRLWGDNARVDAEAEADLGLVAGSAAAEVR